VLFASCFSDADLTFSGNRQNLFRKPPEQLATFYAYLHTKYTSHFSKEGVSFGMLRMRNYIGFFIILLLIKLKKYKEYENSRLVFIF
jgi:hypothetical protein